MFYLVQVSGKEKATLGVELKGRPVSYITAFVQAVVWLHACQTGSPSVPILLETNLRCREVRSWPLTS